MSFIPNKTFEDLEFDKVLNQVASFSITTMAKDLILDLKPIEDYDKIKLSLLITSEFKSSFENDNKIPNHGFESLEKPIQLFKDD